MRNRSRALTVLAVVALGLLAVLAPVGPASAAGGGRPSPVRITIQSDLSGRVVSDRDGCVRHRLVYLLGHTQSGDVTAYGIPESGNQGRFGPPAPRGGRSDAFAVTLGDAHCRVAQSRTVDAPDTAAAPASRRITLHATTTALEGRVTSPRKGCVKGVDVVFFVKQASTPFQPVTAERTNRHGRYRLAIGGARLDRGTDVQLLAVALGDDACRVAQSPTRTLSP